jgi:hypothetical protein
MVLSEYLGASAGKERPEGFDAATKSCFDRTEDIAKWFRAWWTAPRPCRGEGPTKTKREDLKWTSGQINNNRQSKQRLWGKSDSD